MSECMSLLWISRCQVHSGVSPSNADCWSSKQKQNLKQAAVYTSSRKVKAHRVQGICPRSLNSDRIYAGNHMVVFDKGPHPLAGAPPHHSFPSKPKTLMILQEGVAFLSHQWASFEHPDPDGVQYRTPLAVLKAFSRSIGVI